MTPSTPAAVLWDMDGTLIDTEPQWVRAENDLLAEFQLVLPEDAHEKLVGSGLWDAAEYLRTLGVDMRPDDIVHRLSDTVAQGVLSDGPAWRPGAIELLTELAEEGIPCALVTMSIRSLAEIVLSLLPEEARAAFVLLIPGDEVTAEKPDPAPYLMAAEALKVDIVDCLVLEDSVTGLRSAAASGAVSVGIPNLVSIEQAPAHSLLPTLARCSLSTVQTLFSTHRGTSPLHATPPKGPQFS